MSRYEKRPSLVLWLVRHGESEQNARMLGRDYPDYPDHAAPLTDAGLEQASDAGKFLARALEAHGCPPDEAVLFYSPYVRARQTAERILEKLPGVPGVSNDMLVEQDFGLFDGVPLYEIQTIYAKEHRVFSRARQYGGKFFARRPNGERPLDVEVRQRLFLDDMHRYLMGHPSVKHVIVVGHGAQLTVLRKLLRSESYEWYEGQPNPGNASVRRLVLWTDGSCNDFGYAYGGDGINEADGN